MKVQICKTIDIETEVDIDIDDLLAEQSSERTQS